jgi:hypothetical protein
MGQYLDRPTRWAVFLIATACVAVGATVFFLAVARLMAAVMDLFR